MKRKLLISACLFLLSTCLFSCKKDSSSSSAITLLTGSRWTFQKYEYNQNGTWIPDPDAVDADKFTIGFNANNTFSENDLYNGETTTGTWNFSSNNTVITTTGGGDISQGVYTVTILNLSTLQLTNLNYPEYNGERLTFTH